MAERVAKIVYKKSLGGKKVHIWLDDKALKTASQIENLSAFVRLALEQAPSLMAWAILQEKDPETYVSTHPPVEELAEKFNSRYPTTKLTASRTKNRRTVSTPKSPPKPELW